MRLLFFGDIIGRPGRNAYIAQLGDIRERLKADFVVVNGENTAAGFGITEDIFNSLIEAGTDVVTLGNHAWDQREALVFIERSPALLRPANYPPGTPGRGCSLYEAANGGQVLVMNVMGQITMNPLDDPFAAVERELSACPLGEACDAVIIDIHAEATSEKMAMGHFADGRASLVVGTHTHVPTSDHQILPGGTGYMTDAGMCGSYNSVIGMDKDEPVNRFVTKVPGSRFTPADDEVTLSGVLVETDDRTGLARNIGPLRVGGRLEPVWPDF
jgi:metallophosphoesterase (TIGR00282 family)